MKLKSILPGLGFVVFFFIVVNLIPKSGKIYYEFQNYKKTIDSPINGVVRRLVEGKSFFGAQFGLDSNNYYGFTFHVERTPKQWSEDYPHDFIIVGDSISKKANNDTFQVFRKASMWMYILPRE